MIVLQNIAKTYHLEGAQVNALRGINLHITCGEMTALVGSSGSGKSTLMHILGCLDRPETGKYYLEGKDVSCLSDNELAQVRNLRIGFVFQSFNLLPRLSALENVELPLLYRKHKGAKKKAQEMLELVGLGHRINHRPSQLSGGQNQRVAIARALITDPAILLADEPTGNLDSATGDEIMKFFQDLNKQGRTIIVVTHEPDIAEKCRRKVHIKDGLIVE